MIKYFDLQRISESFEPELSETVVRVTRSGWYLQGEETRAFEEVFAGYCGCLDPYFYGLSRVGRDAAGR